MLSVMKRSIASNLRVDGEGGVAIKTGGGDALARSISDMFTYSLFHLLTHTGANLGNLRQLCWS
jgi:hypothetical protein